VIDKINSRPELRGRSSTRESLNPTRVGSEVIGQPRTGTKWIEHTAQALVSKPHPRTRTRGPGRRIHEPWNDLGKYEQDDSDNDNNLLSVFYNV
jgi:hypothetical protein